jgi:hypothetical protein
MPVGYKLRFPAFEKAQFVTALGIALNLPFFIRLKILMSCPAFPPANPFIV